MGLGICSRSATAPASSRCPRLPRRCKQFTSSAGDSMRRLGVILLGAIVMTASLAAAVNAPVAAAAAAATRNRPHPPQGRRGVNARGRRHDRAPLGCQLGDLELTSILVYGGANVGAVTRIGQCAAPHRCPRWQRPGRQDADRRPSQRGRGELAERRDGAAPRRQLRQRRGSPPPARCQVGRQREGTRVGPDAAHLRRLAEPRRDHQAPDVARRRRQDHQQVDRPRQGRPGSIARRVDCSEKFSTPPWPRARSRPPARFEASVQAARELLLSGLRLPRRVQPTLAARSQLQPEDQPAGQRQGGMTAACAVRQGYVEAAPHPTAAPTSTR